MRQRFFSLGLLALSTRLLACSGSSSIDGSGAGAGVATSAGDANSAGRAGDAGGAGNVGGTASVAGRDGSAGSAALSGSSGAAGTRAVAGSSGVGGDDTSGCPVWPQARLMPIIGPFFYGPNPGPCSNNDSAQSVKYTYQGGVLQSELEDSHGVQVVTTYSSDAQGRFTMSSQGDMIDVYEFGANSLVDTETVGGMFRQEVRYSLSSSGYPLSAVVTLANHTSLSVSYTYASCRLFQRTIVGPTGALTEQDSYKYDSAGRVIARSTGTDEQKYDYSCW